MKYGLFLITFLFSVTCNSQDVLPDSLLKQDFGILSKVVGDMSPNLNAAEREALYTYLDKRAEELNDQPMTVIGFFRFLMDTKANTKLDEHGSLTLSGEVLKTLLTGKKVLFPVPVLFLNNTLVVNHEKAAIPFGSVITAINSVPAATILDDMLKGKSTYALRSLERTFDVLYLIKYGAPETFTLTYTAPGSNTPATAEVSPVDIGTRESIYRGMVYPLNRESLRNVIHTAYFEKADAFYLQLNSFNWNAQVKNIYETFDAQFAEIFKTIRKQNPKNLIIDLRYNQGGDILIPALFYSYIAREDFNEYIAVRVPDFDLPYKDYIVEIENRPVTREVVEGFLTGFQKPFVKKEGYYEDVYVKNVKRSANKKGFSGTVYLLVGGRTFSAAAYYTALFRNFKRGPIAGEQTGGSHHSITAGKQFIFELPNTKIRLSMPIGILNFSEELETRVPEEKVVPDILVTDEMKYRYLLQKKDWDLEEVFNRIMQ